MNIDPNLEANLNWHKRADALVGGPKPYVPPDEYGMDVVEASVQREFYIAGPAYTDALFAVHRPIMPNTGKLSLMLEYMTDQDTWLEAQALEFDTRLAISKIGYNFSSQFNYAKGGVWQAYVTGKGWVDTPFKPGKFAPNAWVKLRFDYAFDILKKTYSFVAVAAGPVTAPSVPFLLPAQFQNLPATPLNWSNSCSLQIQLDLAGKGGGYRTRATNVAYIWS